MKMKYFVAFMLLPLLIVGCTIERDDFGKTDDNENKVTKIFAGDAASIATSKAAKTRTTLGGEDGLEVHWINGDKLGLINVDAVTNSNKQFNFIPGEVGVYDFGGDIGEVDYGPDKDWGYFTANSDGLEEGTWKSYYPYIPTVATIDNPLDISATMTQSTPDNTEHISKNDILISAGVKISVKDGLVNSRFEMEHFYSLIELDISLQVALSGNAYLAISALGIQGVGDDNMDYYLGLSDEPVTNYPFASGVYFSKEGELMPVFKALSPGIIIGEPYVPMVYGTTYKYYLLVRQNPENSNQRSVTFGLRYRNSAAQEDAALTPKSRSVIINKNAVFQPGYKYTMDIRIVPNASSMGDSNIVILSYK